MLEMGNPVKIVDLAVEMILISGLTLKDELHPEADIEIQFTGLRPGEKLHEELSTEDNYQGTDHSRIMQAAELFMPWDETQLLLNDINTHCNNFAYKKPHETIMSSPSMFTPNSGIDDLIFLSEKERPNLQLINLPKNSNKQRTNLV